MLNTIAFCISESDTLCSHRVRQIANELGVDNQMPPNLKIFDPVHVDPAENAVIARRASRGRSENNGGITVNFAGLAELLNGKAATPSLATGTTALLPRIPRKISLEDFCMRYQLTARIRDKLNDLDITGPHALRFLTDEDLRDQGFLSIAQVADVRDAQERWQGDIPE